MANVQKTNYCKGHLLVFSQISLKNYVKITL